MMSEAKIQAAILRMIKTEYPDVWVYKTHDALHKPTIIGVPDLILCVGNQGRFAAIEVKTPSGLIKPIQQYTIEKINQSGGAARVCRCVAEARDLIKEVAI